MDSLNAARIGSSRAITQLILNLVEGTPIKLIDGGQQKRCFTDIRDGIEALFRIIVNDAIGAMAKSLISATLTTKPVFRNWRRCCSTVLISIRCAAISHRLPVSRSSKAVVITARVIRMSHTGNPVSTMPGAVWAGNRLLRCVIRLKKRWTSSCAA